MNKWVNEYIGTPWVFGGRNKETGLDCYGLVRSVLRDIFGIETVDVSIDSYSFKNVKNEFKTAKEFCNWQKTETPRNGDIVLLKLGETANHVGIYLDNSVLHSIEGQGVVFSSIINLEQLGWRVASYMRHKTSENR